MFRSTSSSRTPGALLLRIGSLVFDDTVMVTVIHPVIADLHAELRLATNTRQRLLARWHACRAFWTLVLLAPVAFWDWPVVRRGGPAFPDVTGRLAAGLIVLTSVSVVWRVAGTWLLALLLPMYALLALALHRWHQRHPVRVAVPDRTRRPEINVSAIHVGGDIGGLLYVVGSVLTVMIGLPLVRWWVAWVIVASLALAIGLVRWRAGHPAPLHPANSILR